MLKISQKFNNVYIEKSVLSSVPAKRVLDIFPSNKVHIISSKKELYSATKQSESGNLSASQFSKSKKNLLLSAFKGKFFKRCPGARPGLVCCNYFVLNLGQNCDMDCSYCYLQSFINSPFIEIYTNIESALEELSSLGSEFDKQALRIGTGEITDSLSLDDLTLHSACLVDYFKQKKHWTLEFKTKSANVNNFISQGPASNVIVSWSLNPQYIVEKEEHGTACLEDRLKAAYLCKDKGFSIAFHLDPVIYHKNWQIHYTDLVQQIKKLFCAQDVAHISMGALRFQPQQRHIMRKRFGMQSVVVSGEYFKSTDGKFRYDSDLRNKMFSFIKYQFLSGGTGGTSQNWNIFLCMENKENWLSVMNHTPWQKSSNTQKLFDMKPVHLFRSK